MVIDVFKALFMNIDLLCFCGTDSGVPIIDAVDE